MFDVASTELLLLGAVAVAVIPPKDLPGIDDLRAAGLLDPVDLALEQTRMSFEDDDLQQSVEKVDEED